MGDFFIVLYAYAHANHLQIFREWFISPTITVVPEPGRPGGPLAPQYFAEQLTLFEPGRADYPHLLLLPPHVFHLPASLYKERKLERS